MMKELYTQEYFQAIEKEEKPMAIRLALIIMAMFQPQSVVDFGCATGLYLQPFSEAGLEVWGVDNAEAAKAMSQIPDRIILADLADAVDVGKYDIALCLETIEHIDQSHETQVLANICKASDLIIFSAAIEGQGGEGHVNLRSQEYWKERFAERGFSYDEKDTSKFLAQVKAGYHLGWLTQNGMIFRKDTTEPVVVQDFGNWSLGQKMRELLYAVVPHDASILELGSGAASGELSKYYDVMSIEHDLAWVGNYPTVTYISVPLKDGWYDPKFVRVCLEEVEQYDVLIIDGPVGSESRALFYKHRDLFNLDGWIFVDDCHRPVDAHMYAQLCIDLGTNRGNAIFEDTYGKAFGVIAPAGFIDLDKIATEFGLVYYNAPDQNSVWDKAQEAEKAWWGDCRNTADEEAKQLQYAKKIGLYMVDGYIDMQGKSVLDIGGGPVSLLLACRNVKGKVVDPLSFPSWVGERYAEAGIEYERIKAEDMDESGYDEVWMYNVLTHVDDPEQVILNARAAGAVLRIFDWIDIPRDVTHPHTLTAEQLDTWFGDGSECRITEPLKDETRQGGSYYGVFPQWQLKIIHFVLTSDELTYPYYLAIKSALKTQKADRFILWGFGKPSGKYWPLLKDVVELKIVPMPDIAAFSENTREYKILAKNFLEYSALYKYGGIFLDLDTFCLEDITYLLDSDKELIVSNEVEDDAPSYPFYNICIAGCQRHSPLMKQIVDTTETALSYEKTQIRDVSRLLTNVGRENPDALLTTEYGVLGAGGVDKRVRRLEREDGNVWGNAKVLHLFANDSPFFAELSEEFICNSDILFARTVQDILNLTEWGPIWNRKAGTASGHPGRSGSIGDPTGPPGTPGPPGIMLKYNSPSNPIVRPKRFHLLGLPHVATNKREALACAFSQKVIKMGHMLKSLGHTVFFYGVEGSTVECDEFIQVSTQKVLREAYGEYDYKLETYRHASDDIAYHTFNDNVITEVRKRMDSNDFLLIPFSPPRYAKIIKALDTPYIDQVDRLYLVVESGIGYRGTSCRFKVFESSSQMHYCMGLENQADGKNYDVVIPNFFDPDDFAYSAEKHDYFLFLGRVIIRKGVATAVATINAIGGKLIIAGQDGHENVDLSSPNVEYVGFANLTKRKELLKNAKALILPTQYVEPFGGVIIEAALSGTPVITSNHGAFRELVDHGKTGFRCNTLDQYVFAAQTIGEIKPIDCYNYAMQNFTLDRVRWQYEEYFNMLLDVKEHKNKQGFNRLHPERLDLDWQNMVRDYA